MSAGHEVCDEKFIAMSKLMDEKLHTLSQTVADGFARQQVSMQSIEVQTKKTNGRVSSLELWKARIIAAVTALGLVYGGPDLVKAIITGLFP